jgi:tryptophan 6-halogenase
MDQRIREVVVLGGGTAGWMTASYLQKVFEGSLTITVLEAPAIPRIGVGEATVPNLQRVFFDQLGLREEQWMRECNGSFKMAVKFVNWRKREPDGPPHHFYHSFGLMPKVDTIPLSHFWVHRYYRGEAEAFDYACYHEPPLMDAKRAPRFFDGTRAAWYAWHFDAALVAGYLQRLAVGWGVRHIAEECEQVVLDSRGYIESLRTKSGRVVAGDFFIDCSGFKGVLINKAMGEPFVDMSDYLLCDSAVATQIPHDDDRYGIEPYTSSIAMNSGWTWKIPMLGRFGTGYVYSSRFCTQDEAIRDFADLWRIDPETTELNRIKFRVGRNRRAWVKNCASIGLASCFVEPLESVGIYFTYAAIHYLAKHFPSRDFEPGLIDHFNREIEFMFDDSRDFIQAHYLTASRDDTSFWKANRHELKVSDSLRDKLAIYKSGLTVNMPIADEDAYYSDFEAEFHNFWTDSSFYCVLAGNGFVPDSPLPTIAHRASALRSAEARFADVKRRQADLLRRLPSCVDYLRLLHGKADSIAQHAPA